MELLFFTISLLAYFILHSLLASNVVKARAEKYFNAQRYYRLAYNIVAFGYLAVLTWHFLLINKVVLLDNTLIKWPAVLLLLAGLVWVVKALQGYDLAEFIGTSQLQKSAKKSPIVLKTNGLNSLVRHPLYFGTLLMVWGAFFLLPTDASLIVAAVTTLYIFIGAHLEERKLEQQFGETYRLYRNRVPMIIPFRWKSREK